jgi:predicted small metal-binding protein
MFRKTLTSLVFNHKVDAELRRLARKYVKGYALLGSLGKAQANAEIMRKIVKHIHQHADAMERETAVESSMLDDNNVRQYIDLVIGETEGKKDDRTVGAHL